MEPRSIEGLISTVKIAVSEKNKTSFHAEEGVIVFAFQDDKGFIKMPSGKVFSTHSKELADILVSRLELESSLDVTTTNLFSLHCTIEDNGHLSYEVTRREILGNLINDSIFRSFHPLDEVERNKRYATLELFEEQYELVHTTIHPEQFQIEGTNEIDWNQFADSLPNEFSKWTDACWTEYQTLTASERIVLSYLTIESNGCFVFGLMLITDRISLLDYFRSTMSANGFQANNLEENIQEYRLAYKERMPHVSDLLEYLNADRKYRYQLTLNQFKSKVNIGLLPQLSQNALLSAIQLFHQKQQVDYSPVVIQLAKTIEIILKDQIFDRFHDKVRFRKSSGEIELIDPNGKAKTLGRYLDKETPIIALGEMLFILKLQGGKTQSREPLLNSFLRYVEKDSKYPAVLDKGFIERAQLLSSKRNAAAHRASFNDKTEIDELIQLTCELLAHMNSV